MKDQSSWHIPDEVLVAYVGEWADAPEAWSAEAHLVLCPACRRRLSELVDVSPLAGVLATSQADLAAVLPGSGRGFVATRPAHLVSRSLGRWPWLVAVVVATLAALGLTQLVAMVHPDRTAVPLTWALAPIVPLAGVALTFTRRSDPWAEVVLSTPKQGLALVLWRSAAVLVAAAPLTLAVGQVPGVDTGGRFTSAGMSLVAMLALTLLALALGTHTGVEVAALLVAGGWSVLTIFPMLLAAPAWGAVLSPGALPVWGAVIVASAGLVVARRVAFERLPTFGLPNVGVR